jgi:hypothetical protein
MFIPFLQIIRHTFNFRLFAPWLTFKSLTVNLRTTGFVQKFSKLITLHLCVLFGS